MYFSLYVFLLMTLLDVHFIFILDYGHDVRQKANSSDFLEFKVGHKAAETSLKINRQPIWPRNCQQMYRAVVVQEVL